ncbi:DUF72 domain-containing protein [Dongia sedimenti]|uniref:DUF72 domain-containing protein n=1 Tax=Dongia sedimenti TaxID=3064282 RepID=A0ABU0YTV6_9PROT|nr:DUF72 domain-containing protein [Rhodospirillaceae bacterium R-7]
MALGGIRIGISGWRYAPWRGKFYPKGLRQKDELAYAASKFPTVEINGTFYSLQSPDSFRQWAAATPDNFVFAVKGRTTLEIDHKRRLRHAIEIRHDSFRTPAFIALLRKHRIGLVCADTVDWPLLMDLTADFIYCRLHGSEELYASGYDDTTLKRWAIRVAAWAKGREPADALRVTAKPAPRPAGASKGRDVYVYFDNDAKVRAPVDAARLAQLVKPALR